MAFIEIDPFGASLVHIDDFGVIETEQTKDRGMQIVDVNLVFDRMQTEFVGFADDLSAFYASTGHPHGETSRVVVPPVSFLAHRRTPEFSTPDDQRLVQKAAGLEVGDETDYGQIDLPAKFGVVALHLGVAVPLAAGSVIELDEADPAF